MREVQARAEIRRLAPNIRFTETREGLRIDIVDDADFSMFVMGTSQLTPEASHILTQLANTVAEVPNQLMIRGHNIGSASCRGRMCQYVEISVVLVTFKKKT